MKKASNINLLKQYYLLTKPGIVRGNAITAAAGFLFASDGNVSFRLLLEMLVGLSLVIASSCVFNNYIDRDIDKRMARTSKRALVKGTINLQIALIYGTVLGLGGFAILAVYVNWLPALIALAGFITYVGIYTQAKRKTKYGTMIGSVSGAVPPVVGYCAVTNRLDSTALLLFIILACWQMPHFYAIAIYRAKEYAAAKIPVWSLAVGVEATKKQMLIYIAAFTAALAGLWLAGDAGYTYLAVSIATGLYWLWFGLKGFNQKNSERWAKQMFGISLLVLTIFSVLISINTYLP